MNDIFSGLSAATLHLLMPNDAEKARLTSIIEKVTADPAQLAPAAHNIFAAFRDCPLEAATAVILGQDPYPGKDKAGATVANGKSYSTAPHITIQPSARAIFTCLTKSGLMTEMPRHGDLNAWSNQGILLLNAIPTTLIGKSEAHVRDWRDYMAALFERLATYRNVKGHLLVFLAFGLPAKALLEKATKSIEEKPKMLCWGHPSPLNSANRSITNLGHFSHCTTFIQLNKILTDRGDKPIDWNLPVIDIPLSQKRPREIKPKKINNTVAETKENNQDIKEGPREIIVAPSSILPPTQENGPIYVFTDGAASANGKPNCRASWAYHIPALAKQDRGIVAPIAIPGKVYTSSNNRGELMAVTQALAYLCTGPAANRAVTIMSDSEYAIKTLSVWAATWLSNPKKHKLSEKLNFDLIEPGLALIAQLRQSAASLTFEHVKAHQKEPFVPHESREWQLWHGNKTADGLCESLLR